MPTDRGTVGRLGGDPSPVRPDRRDVDDKELGLDGRIDDFIGYYSFFEMNQLILAYHVQVQGEIVLGEELAEFKMVPPEKLRPWEFGTGYAVKDWLEKRKHTKAAE